jgi:hypothetical protein
MAPRLTVFNLAPQKYYDAASGYMVIVFLNNTVSSPEVNDLKENVKMFTNNVIHSNVSEYFPVDATYLLFSDESFKKYFILYLKLRVTLCYKENKIQDAF